MRKTYSEMIDDILDAEFYYEEQQAIRNEEESNGK